MKNTSGNFSFVTAILIAICVFSIILAFSAFDQAKRAEGSFKKEKAALLQEGEELKNRLKLLSKAIQKDREIIASLESERRAFENELADIERTSAGEKEKNDRTIALLKRENVKMRGEMGALKKASATDLIKEMVSREPDENIKRVLSDTLVKITMVKEGKVVQLEPIVVAGENERALNPQNRREGKILSLDKRSNLVVIDLGMAQGLKEGQRCRIFGTAGEIASAMIIKTRYEISAAFVDTFLSKYTIEDIGEGAKVLIG